MREAIRKATNNVRLVLNQELITVIEAGVDNSNVFDEGQPDWSKPETKWEGSSDWQPVRAEALNRAGLDIGINAYKVFLDYRPLPRVQRLQRSDGSTWEILSATNWEDSYSAVIVERAT